MLRNNKTPFGSFTYNQNYSSLFDVTGEKENDLLPKNWSTCSVSL